MAQLKSLCNELETQVQDYEKLNEEYERKQKLWQEEKTRGRHWIGLHQPSGSRYWPMWGYYWGYRTYNDQWKASIEVIWQILTNERPLLKSYDNYWPMRGHYWGQATNIDQWCSGEQHAMSERLPGQDGVWEAEVRVHVADEGGGTCHRRLTAWLQLQTGGEAQVLTNQRSVLRSRD